MISSATLFLLLALGTYTIWRPEGWILSAIEAGVLGLAAVWLFNASRGSRSMRCGAGLSLLVAGVAWLAALTAAGASVYGFASVVELIHWAALLAVYMLGLQLFAEARCRRLFLSWFLIFGTVTAVYAVAQYFTSEGRFLWTIDSGYPDLLGPFQNRNNFAAFVELLVPLALWRSIRETSDRWLWLGVTAALVAAVAASASRAGTAIVMGELLAVLGLSWRRKILAPRQLAMCAALLAAMVLAGTLVVGWDALLRRMGEVNPLGYRAEILDSTVSMVAARPWTGFGPGTFEDVYPAFARFDIGFVVNHAHNDWLEWAFEGGLPLLLLLASFAVWHVRPAVQSVWGLGVVAVFLHALVDYPFQRLGVAGWAFLMLAAIAAESRHRRLSLDNARRPQTRDLAG